MPDKQTDSQAASEPQVRSSDLLGELWTRLKLLDEHCTDSMAVALTPRSFDCIEGQRMAFREIQNWLLAHGYSPNVQSSATPPGKVNN